MRARQPSYSYSMSFIDVLSQLSGDRLRSSKARGIKFGLPCGKFDFYDAQMRDMLELLTDRNFAEKCVRTFGKVTEKLPQLRAKMHAPTRQVVKGQKKAHDALLHLEDLVALGSLTAPAASFLRAAVALSPFVAENDQRWTVHEWDQPAFCKELYRFRK